MRTPALKLSDETGYSIVEVAIASGIFVVLALAAAQISHNLILATQYGSDSSSVRGLSTLVRERVKYADACTAALSGVNSNINRNQLQNGTVQANVLIPSLHGVGTNPDLLSQGQTLPELKLKVVGLKFANVVNVAADTYIANLELRSSSLSNGVSFKPILIGSVEIVLSGPPGNSSIASCNGQSSTVTQQLCTDMSCQWVNLPTPSCQCPTINSLCPVGQYPIAFTSSGPTCQTLGGAPCGPNEYLYSVGLGTSQCRTIAGAPSSPTVTNGGCGGANGGAFSSAPSSNLCLSGSPSAVSLNGSNYSWSCSGTNGGTTASCTAVQVASGSPTNCWSYTWFGAIASGGTSVSAGGACGAFSSQNTCESDRSSFGSGSTMNGYVSSTSWGTSACTQNLPCMVVNTGQCPNGHVPN